MFTHEEIKKQIELNGINRWVFQIPLSDVKTSENQTDGESTCLLCGRKLGKNPVYVHLLINGNLVSSNQDFDISQGFFAIGSECKKRLPNNFYF